MQFTHKMLIGMLLFVAGVGYGWNRLGKGVVPVLSPVPPLPSLSPTVKLDERASEAEALGLQVPQGFKLVLFARDLGKPRVLYIDPLGRLLVSVPEEGLVLALPDENADGLADETVVVVDKLRQPHGLAMKCLENECDLYVAETHQVSSFRYDLMTMRATRGEVVATLPEGGRHWSRTLLFDPLRPETLMVAMGSSCDTCVEADSRRAAVWELDVNTKVFRAYAQGLRNSVFMRGHPKTGEVWATEMGRDFLGDNLPPEEVNVIHAGGHYGWPWCFGERVPDRRFDAAGERVEFCQTTIAPKITFQAHSAPLGLDFTPEAWPSEYTDSLLVAQHGSWNRSTPTGYRIVRFDLASEPPRESVFIAGWLKNDGSASGRPVDVVVGPSHELYISDDKAGVIYRGWF